MAICSTEAHQLLHKEPALMQMLEDLTVPLHIKESSSAAQTEQSFPFAWLTTYHDNWWLIKVEGLCLGQLLLLLIHNPPGKIGCRRIGFLGFREEGNRFTHHHSTCEWISHVHAGG